VAKRKSNPLAKLLQEAKRYQADQKKIRLKNKKLAQRAITKAADDDLIAKWRALNKIGAISAKASPAKKNLTKHRRAEIRKAFDTVQKQTHYSKGVVFRPLQKDVEITKRIYRDARTGKRVEKITQKVRYDLTDHFRMVKSKNKPNVKTGIVKTKKGYLVETTHANTRVRIDKKGNVIEETSVGTRKVKITREGITGKEILKLAEEIKAGKFKIPPHTALALHHWGTARAKQSFAWNDLDSLAYLIELYERRMSEKEFENWIEYTEINLEDIGPQIRRQ